jgi:hypothetical protein
MWLFDTSHENISVPSRRMLFVEAIFSSAIGLIAAWVLFQETAGLISIFLITLAEGRRVEQLLNRNSHEIWHKELLAKKANAKLAFDLLILFSGIFLVYWLTGVLLDETQRYDMFPIQSSYMNSQMLHQYDFGTAAQIFGHNIMVLLALFIGSFLYRGGGVFLILCWNASVWGIVLGSIFSLWSASHSASFISVVGATLSILPHLFTEAAGYVLAGMSGVFISKAIDKYAFTSKENLQVFRAVAMLLIVSCGIIGAAALIEASFAPAMLKWIL